MGNIPALIGAFNQVGATEFKEHLWMVGADNFSASVQLPQNLCGTVSSITHQRQKNIKYAPAGATYLLIQAADTESGTAMDCIVFLGANNTDDFNLRGNAHYRYDITIRGIDQTDTRVSYKQYDIQQFANNWKVGTTQNSIATASFTNNTDNYCILSYQRMSGNGVLKVDGATLEPGTPYRIIPQGVASGSVALSYEQHTPGHVILDVKMTDRYGYTYTKAIGGMCDYDLDFDWTVEAVYGYSQMRRLWLTIRQQEAFRDPMLRFSNLSNQVEVIDEAEGVSTEITYKPVGRHPFLIVNRDAPVPIKVKLTLSRSHEDQRAVSKEITIDYYA